MRDTTVVHGYTLSDVDRLARQACAAGWAIVPATEETP